MNCFIIILIIGLLILIHELGHFILARLNGIPVAIFSIGFGPKIWKWRKKGTEYRISAIPIGGYILPAIENEVDFYKIPAYKRIFFAVGGPLANILLPLLLFVIISISSSDLTPTGIIIEPIARTFSLIENILISIPNLFNKPEQLSGIVGIIAHGGHYIESDIQRALNLSIILQ